MESLVTSSITWLQCSTASPWRDTQRDLKVAALVVLLNKQPWLRRPAVPSACCPHTARAGQPCRRWGSSPRCLIPKQANKSRFELTSLLHQKVYNKEKKIHVKPVTDEFTNGCKVSCQWTQDHHVVAVDISWRWCTYLPFRLKCTSQCAVVDPLFDLGPVHQHSEGVQEEQLTSARLKAPPVILHHGNSILKKQHGDSWPPGSFYPQVVPQPKLTWTFSLPRVWSTLRLICSRSGQRHGKTAVNVGFVSMLKEQFRFAEIRFSYKQLLSYLLLRSSWMTEWHLQCSLEHWGSGIFC